MGNCLFIDRTLYAGGHIYDALLAKEPNIAQVDRDQPFYRVFWIPLKEFFQRKGVAQAIGFYSFCSCINLVIHLPPRYKRNLSMT